MTLLLTPQIIPYPKLEVYVGVIFVAFGQFKRTACWEECSPEEKVMKKNFVVRSIEQL